MCRIVREGRRVKYRSDGSTIKLRLAKWGEMANCGCIVVHSLCIFEATVMGLYISYGILSEKGVTSYLNEIFIHSWFVFWVSHIMVVKVILVILPWF